MVKTGRAFEDWTLNSSAESNGHEHVPLSGGLHDLRWYWLHLSDSRFTTLTWNYSCNQIKGVSSVSIQFVCYSGVLVTLIVLNIDMLAYIHTWGIRSDIFYFSFVFVCYEVVAFLILVCSRYVLECSNCNVIYRSRQHWFGNVDPEHSGVLKARVRHIWPGVMVCNVVVVAW